MSNFLVLFLFLLPHSFWVEYAFDSISTLFIPELKIFVRIIDFLIINEQSTLDATTIMKNRIIRYGHLGVFCRSKKRRKTQTNHLL